MKLSPSVLKDIARDWDQRMPQTLIAQKYGITQSYVSRLIRMGFRHKTRRVRLTPDQVAAVRHDHARQPLLSAFELAAKYGVSAGTISRALRVNPQTVADVRRDRAQHPEWPLEQIALHNGVPVLDVVKILRKK